MTKVAIIGGGIAGLSAALWTKLKFPKKSVVLFESTDKLGGWIQSNRFTDGSVHELGPRTIRMQSKSTLDILNLIELCGLESKVISISKMNENFNKRFIYANKQLHQLDLSLYKPARRPFSESMLLKLVKASLKNFGPEKSAKDLPVDYFFRSRFGDEVADYIVNPVVRGIYACDSKHLSVLSSFPDLLELERKEGNAMLGVAKKYLKDLFNDKSEYRHLNRAIQEFQKNSAVIGFRGGLQSIIDGLERTLKENAVEIVTGTMVDTVGWEGQRQLYVQNQTMHLACDAVICAVPSHVAGTILRKLPIDAKLLSSIKWNTIAVVVLEYEGRLEHRSGFGHLIPSWESPHILGMVYDSCVLPELDSRAGESTRLTVMLGGAWFSPHLDDLDAAQLQQMAQEAVSTQLSLASLPALRRASVAVHHNCVPQYGLQHGVLVDQLRSEIASLPLALCGNSYDGVSVSDCVRSGFRAAEKLF